VFSRLEDAIAYVKRCQRPLVVKADGLAQGKGVVIAHSSEEAAEALESLMEEKVFGSAGEKVVVEELLQGVEASVFSLCNGTDAVILGSAMDYKRAFDGDQGQTQAVWVVLVLTLCLRAKCSKASWKPS